MRKIRDRIVLGTICGIIASFAGIIPNAIEYKAGLTDMRFNQPAASLFLSKRDAKSNRMESRIIGAMVNNTMVSLTGTMVTYLLSVTGRDKAVLKGAGVGIMQWIGIWGLLSRLGVTVKSNKPLTHMLSFLDHAAFGASVGLLASKLGDDSLFPDKKPAKGEKLPLAGTSQQVRIRPVRHLGQFRKRHA